MWSSSLSRPATLKSNTKVFDDIADKISSMDKETSNREMNEILEKINNSKTKLSPKDFDNIKAAYKDRANIVKEQKFVEKQSKMFNKYEDSFRKRVAKIEEQEKRLSSYRNPSVKESRYRKWLQDKEKLIEEIGEHYNLDQFQASDKYDSFI